MSRITADDDDGELCGNARVDLITRGRGVAELFLSWSPVRATVPAGVSGTVRSIARFIIRACS